MSRASFAIALLALPFAAFAAPSYPVAARVVEAADASEQCSPLGVPLGPTCGLMAPARAALRGAAARMFVPADPKEPPAIELSVKSAAIEAATAGGGYQLTLAIEVSVSLAGKGTAIVRSRGNTLVSEVTPDRIPAAAERAAKDLQIEDDLSNSVELVEWLRSRQIEPRRSLVWPARQPTRFFADLGIGEARGGDSNAATIFFGRLGVEAGRLSVQAFAGKTSPRFTGAASPAVATFGGTLDAFDLGVDGAVSIRVLPYLDLRGGPGLHYLFGDASLETRPAVSKPFSVLTPTLFASVLFAMKPFAGGTRMTVSLEARKFLNSTAEIRELSRAVPVADFSFAAFVGCEVPLGEVTDGKGRISR